jgi:hypothetical protein
MRENSEPRPQVLNTADRTRMAGGNIGYTDRGLPTADKKLNQMEIIQNIKGVKNNPI